MKLDNSTLAQPHTRGFSYIALFLLVALGIASLLGYWLWQARGQIIAQARTDSANLAWVFEDHIDSTLRRADADLSLLALKLPSAALAQAKVAQYSESWTQELALRKLKFPEVANFFVFDSAGLLLYSSVPGINPFSVTERPHFKNLRDTPTLTTAFSDVIVARSTGHLTLSMAKPIRDREGRFQGMVAAVLDFAYLQTMFDSVNIGPNGLIALRNVEHKLVLRRPHLKDQLNKPVRSPLTERMAAGEKSGNSRFDSPVDGHTRTASFRVLRNYPFNIVVAIADADILVTWQRGALLSTVSALGVLTLLGLLLLRLWRAELRRGQALIELQERERSLLEAKNAAEAANVAKSAFLASMSHELRTPLNAVLGYAQLLGMDDEAAPGVRESAGEIEKAGQHLLALVNDVLDLARIESGRLDVASERVALDAVIEESRQLIMARARERGISLDIAPTAVDLQADPVRLRQVLLNLMSNAVKYNRDGGRVIIRGESQANGSYRVAVTDTGAGIAAKRMGELFQPFNRMGAEQGPIEGTGIGLVITRSLVELMHGRIGVESVVGQGSTFWVELPLASSSAQ